MGDPLSLKSRRIKITISLRSAPRPGADQIVWNKKKIKSMGRAVPMKKKVYLKDRRGKNTMSCYKN